MCRGCVVIVYEVLRMRYFPALPDSEKKIWSCSFWGISVLIAFSICTCKPMVVNDGTSEGKRKKM